MKLLRLKITDPAGFRSLKPGFEHHFRAEWALKDELASSDGFAPFVCAGPNGSGKSNLSKLLKGPGGFRSARVGGLRMIFVVVQTELLITIERTGPRGQVYRDL